MVDMGNGFWSVPLAEDIQNYLPFAVEGTQYQWMRLPQGLHNSLTVYYQASRTQPMSSVAQPMTSIIIQYIDDVINAADDILDDEVGSACQRNNAAESWPHSVCWWLISGGGWSKKNWMECHNRLWNSGSRFFGPWRFPTGRIQEATAEAYKLAADKMASALVDSWYRWGLAHDFGQIWNQRNFLTAVGIPMKIESLARELLGALQSPRKSPYWKPNHIHTKKSLLRTHKKNALANVAAKEAAIGGEIGLAACKTIVRLVPMA